MWVIGRIVFQNRPKRDHQPDAVYVAAKVVSHFIKHIAKCENWILKIIGKKQQD